LRAGLLSRLDIIEYLNSHFVCTWILDTAANRLIDEAETEANRGLMQTLYDNWAWPVTFEFLNQQGEFVTGLNSLEDFDASPLPNHEFMLNHLAEHFPGH
jgi:hypothetical protein